MIRARNSCNRNLGTAIFLLAGIVRTVGWAADSSTQASIATAKQNYAAIKETARDAKQPVTGATNSSVPPLELPNDKIPVLSPIQRARQLEALATKPEAKKSENWLVDAMNQAESDSKRTESLTRETRQSKATKDEQSSIAGKRAKNGVNDHELRAIEKPLTSERDRVQVSNPLTDYMAGWMSSKDLQILQPQSRTDKVGVLPAGPSADWNAFSPGLLPAAIPGSSGNRDINFSANPYLQDSTITSPVRIQESKQFPHSFAPLLSESNRPVAPLTLVPPEQTKSKANDPLQPPDDDRLFKQLKRF